MSNTKKVLLTVFVVFVGGMLVAIFTDQHRQATGSTSSRGLPALIVPIVFIFILRAIWKESK